MSQPPTEGDRPVPHPTAPTPGTKLGQHYAHCFACGDTASGLHMRFTAGEDLTVSGTFTVTPEHQGAPGLAHGGLLTAAFDEALGALQVFFREPAVTARLQTHFRRPVPVGTTLYLHARVDRREGRKLWVSAQGRLDAPDGPVAAEADALFLVVPAEHFATYGRPEDVAAVRQNPELHNGYLEVNP
ncbi:PaaI family thioesterase [Pseudonocardia bannensis]|uniref:Acyl-coenzyme A thioesterase THEM4 n=1 Tax=Pseudonocardia bannensis TaxID=630973 RepID=A0A848DN75_9PSEU|nr:PaaI family thioesterase [Pseudonocardia bannensis]